MLQDLQYSEADLILISQVLQYRRALSFLSDALYQKCIWNCWVIGSSFLLKISPYTEQS